MKHGFWIGLALMAATCASGASAGPWCGMSDRENWKEFATTFWAGARDGASRPTLYMLSAPWCPYCAQVARSMQSNRYGFDIRMIPVSAQSDEHQKQIADIAYDGTNQSLVRVYLQRKHRDHSLSPTQRAFIEETQAVIQQALYDRYFKAVSAWGSPMSFLVLDGQLSIVQGMPNLEQINRMLPQIASSETNDRLRRFMATGLPAARPMSGRFFAKRDNVRIRVLPDDGALTHLCLARGNDLQADGIVTIDGVDWIAFRQNPPKTAYRVFGKLSDFGR